MSPRTFLYGTAELAAKRLVAELERLGFAPLLVERGLLQDEYWTVQVEVNDDEQRAIVESAVGRVAPHAQRLN